MVVDVVMMRGVLGRIVGGAHTVEAIGRELDGTRASNGSFSLTGGRSFIELYRFPGVVVLGLWSDCGRISA